MEHPHSEPSNPQPPYWKSRTGIALIMLALVVAFYILREHWVHVVGNWPYLLLLLCPLMHFFGHGGHGGHGHNLVDQASPDDKSR
ncbi:MAG: DUF2933 domain-containing protein [Glaciimonas sp.]|nr:DUF2933 domain-containing protein [Glaciimonas sp.]